MSSPTPHDEIEPDYGYNRYSSYQRGGLGQDDSDDDDDEEDDDELAELPFFQRQEARMAERLSVQLLSVSDDDEEQQDRILRKSLRLLDTSGLLDQEERRMSVRMSVQRKSFGMELEEEEKKKQAAQQRLCTMICLAVAGLALISVGLYVGIKVIGPPRLPVGPYQLVERQEGYDFFKFYNFYEGRDSLGSNGYNMYVGLSKATGLGIVNVSLEKDELDVYHTQKRRLANNSTTNNATEAVQQHEPFVYMGSMPTEEGPRDSIRLEGLRRFDRGLFIIDIRHMPAGCGVWPAFWLTDEANWPVNGEIDIVEGVNYQSVAKTALHSTKGCSMTDIPLGVMTGTWDTAQGVPDAKTGVPDMTLRYAQNCFVYDPHQWLNQGCVAVDKAGGTIGKPLNDNGGGVYALDWDPIHRHIRTWVFTPHSSVPDNLVDAIRTASHEEPVAPDPDSWPVPYGYFAVGQGTDCPESKFRHMRLVFNLAFCGSVAGNRFHMDCKAHAKQFDTCNEWIKSEPEELNHAFWKIRGVYVYERQFERAWLN